MEVTRSGANGLLVVSRAVEVNDVVTEPALTRHQRIMEKSVTSRTWDLKPTQKPAEHSHVVSIYDYYTKDIIQIHTNTHIQACMRYSQIYIHTPIHARIHTRTHPHIDRGYSFERNCVLRRWESETLK